jgi:Rieske Fe-S protein
MERKVFLRSIGAGAAFALVFPCLHGCSSDNGPEGGLEIPTGVDFTIDLSGPDGVSLENNGDFIIRNEVVVARNLQGVFVAASRICSHEQNAGVSFTEIQGGIFECEVHGSRFDQSGTPLNTITLNPLKIFNTDLQGNLLRVFE